MNSLLNTKRLYLQKTQCFKKQVPDLFLHKWVENQLQERFQGLLALPPVTQGCFFTPGLNLNPFYHKGCAGVIDTYHLPFKDKTVAGYVESMHLHTLEHPPLYLKEVHRILHQEAYYFSAFPGAESAKHLRYKLIELEAELYGTATLRLLPTLRPEQLGPLLTWAGFKDIVVECMQLSVTYPSLYALARDIRQAGENGILLDNRVSFQPALWKKLNSCWQDLMPLTLDILFMTARP